MYDIVDCVHMIEGSGPPVILIPGIGARHTLWSKVTEHIKRDWTCITYDLRGHGDSPLPSGRFGLEDLVNDLEALRVKLGVDKAHIVGHSLGAMIAAAYACQYPQHVLSLSLCSFSAFRGKEEKDRIAASLASIQENAAEAVNRV